MSDYWDHEEYGALEEKLEKQVATTRKWMALHDEAVEREATLTAELESMKIEATCSHCGLYHGREVCETLLAEVTRMDKRTRHLLTRIEDAEAALLVRDTAYQDDYWAEYPESERGKPIDSGSQVEALDEKGQ